MLTVLEFPPLLLAGGAALSFALLILLTLPKSRLRTWLLPIIGWPVIVCCSSCISLARSASLDAAMGPIWLLVDIGVAVLGITAASVVIHARQDADTSLKN